MFRLGVDIDLAAVSKSIGNSVGSASAVVLVHGYLYIALNGKDAIKEVPEVLLPQ